MILFRNFLLECHVPNYKILGPGDPKCSSSNKSLVNKLQSSIPGLVMSKSLAAAANWLLGPLNFKKQIHASHYHGYNGMDCNGNG